VLAGTDLDGAGAGVGSSSGPDSCHQDGVRAGVGLWCEWCDRIRSPGSRARGRAMFCSPKFDHTPWDTDLGPAMAASGVAVFEEDVLDLLLQDLVVGRAAGTGA